MIDALQFSRHKAASLLFVAFNVLAALLLVVGIVLTTAVYVKSEPTVPPLPQIPSYGGSLGRSVLQAQQLQVQQLAQANDTLGWLRGASASMMLTGYLFATALSLFFAQAIRYLASISESVGKHAMAYLDVVDPGKQTT